MLFVHRMLFEKWVEVNRLFTPFSLNWKPKGLGCVPRPKDRADQRHEYGQRADRESWAESHIQPAAGIYWSEETAKSERL